MNLFGLGVKAGLVQAGRRFHASPCSTAATVETGFGANWPENCLSLVKSRSVHPPPSLVWGGRELLLKPVLQRPPKGVLHSATAVTQVSGCKVHAVISRLHNGRTR
jgi:hypothetical protein